MSGGYGYPVYRPTPTPERPRPPAEPTKEDNALVEIYQQHRLLGQVLERFIDEVSEHVDWSEDDRKRLDKAVVVIKVGFKLVKLVLKTRGFRQLKPESMRRAA